jgi:antitoxin (DNA-binding transcriptional repressor) of toxin-antitoxin stability system
MQTIKASEFKAKCLALMDQVARTGEPLLVTKHGKPVAELRRAGVRRPRSPFGLHKGKSRELGDIIEPIEVEEWEVLK